MASESKTTVDLSADCLRIDGLEITDSDVIEYIDGREEQSPEEVVRLAIRMGVSTLRLSETTEDMEYVRHEFDKINRDFEDQIEDLQDDLENWFDDEEGDFAELIDDTFGKDGDIVEEVFDHTKDGTPMGKLYNDFEKKLKQLREDLIRQDEREDVQQETTIKGEIFQEDLVDLLGDGIRKVDELHFSGEEYGQLDDRFVGDFVITLGETGQDIVIEAKDVSRITKPTIKKELDEGMENRGADYGILVLKNQDAASDFLGGFREFDQKMLYVAISDEDSDTYDKRLLNLAYEWARMRTLSSQFDTGDEVDPELIQNKISEIEDSISEFRNIRTQCSNIESAREEIEKQLNEIQEKVVDEIEEILDEINIEEEAATG